MTKENNTLYEEAEKYLESPDGMRTEVNMWYIAAGLMMRELAIKQSHTPFGGLGGKIGCFVYFLVEPFVLVYVIYN